MIKPRNLVRVQRGCKKLYTALRTNICYNLPFNKFNFKPIILQILLDEFTRSTTFGMSQDLNQTEKIFFTNLKESLAQPRFRQIHQVKLICNKSDVFDDLYKIGCTVIKELPKIKNVRLVISSLCLPVNIKEISALSGIVKTNNIDFGITILFDKNRNIHNWNKENENTFVSQIEPALRMKQEGLSVSICFKITPKNCYEVDDLLLWCEQNNIQQWKFLFGKEFGMPQYNVEQCFHLSMFFSKIAAYPGLDLAQRKYYKNISEHFAIGFPKKEITNKRLRSITIDMYGHILYDNEEKITSTVDSEKREGVILKNNSQNEKSEYLYPYCYSDQIVPLTTAEIARYGINIVSKKIQRFSLNRQSVKTLEKRIQPADKNSPYEWKHVLITGWYGTETAGDKVILGETLHFIKTHSPDCKFTVTSIDRKISEQTKLELADLKDSKIVAIDKGHFPELIESVDAVVIGGGPLMDSSRMENVRRIFLEADRQRKARIIFGCGVGPLHQERMRKITADIIRLTTAGFFRDKESFEYAAQLAPENLLEYACDPAFGYIHRWYTNPQRNQRSKDESSLRIATLLRSNTREFVINKTKEILKDSNEVVAFQIARVLGNISKSNDATIELLHMNAPWIGGDDRLFNRKVANYLNELSLPGHLVRAYFPLDSLLKALLQADVSVAMRYHGHIFSMALGIPFLSIDYTGKPGKVHSLVKRIGYEENSVKWSRIDTDCTTMKFQKLLAEREYWSSNLLKQTEFLVAKLNKTYSRVFGLSEKLKLKYNDF